MKKWLCLPFIFCSLFSIAQTGTEIILFDLKITNGQLLLSNGINITNHKGYDNQPFFHPSQPVIYYSSFDDSSRSDIKHYNYKTGKTSNLTVTREREYSPTVTPDRKFISCIIQRDNEAQDLAKYPAEGGPPQVLINNLKVGYHTWITKDKLLLFVLGDSSTNTLRLYNLPSKSDSIISSNIGRSMHKIPGHNAMSFIQRMPDKQSLVQRWDISSGTMSTITHTLPEQDHITWAQDNIILSGKDDKLFSFKTGTDKDWREIRVIDNSILLKGITRLAANKDNTKLAVVISE